MSNLFCWRCGESLTGQVSLPVRRLDVCKFCNAEVHVCKMCVEFDVRYPNQCREPTVEEVRKKDETNFCDYFRPRIGPSAAFASMPNDAQAALNKAALEKLFRK